MVTATAASPQTPIVFTPPQAAEALGVSEKTLWNYTWPRGRLKVCRIGKLKRYRREDIEAFLEQQLEGAELN